MKTYYFDTDALSWRYVDTIDYRLGAPHTTVTERVNAIVQEVENDCYISEFTLLEWTSVLGKRVRSQQEGFAGFDYEWSVKIEQAIMQDIVAHRLNVYPSIPRVVERARLLVNLIGVGSKRALKTIDAVHLIYAIELAQAKECKVHFVSCDRQLLGVVHDFLPLGRFLQVCRPY